MSNKENGGPAFPFGQTHELSGQLVNGWGSEGMTLRDYFAAKAMTGLVTGAGFQDTNYSESAVAISAYRMADAMLEARK